jgi:uncharacterized integral membrane protein
VRVTGAVNLTAEGLQVREAGEGLDALDQARCEGPDLVLTDVKKLGLAGFQLARLGRRAGARSGASGFGRARGRRSDLAMADRATPPEGEEMQTQSHPTQALPHTETTEPRSERLRRRGHRAGLYTWAFGLVALLVVLIALVIANTRQVKLSWVVGTGHASLVWIILASAVLGWLLGIFTSVVFRLRTRRRRSPAGRGAGGEPR